ncbi:hypothetical protein HDV00_003771 [Rhizophlyctis rosea]|nr:hypothetical protein HDV00_003771 [Rhizophlyctis rosea]
MSTVSEAAQKLLEEENAKLQEELRQTSIQLAQTTKKSRQLLETIVSQQQFLVDIGDRLREVEAGQARDADLRAQLQKAERELTSLRDERGTLVKRLKSFREQYENASELKLFLAQKDKELSACRQQLWDLEGQVRQLAGHSELVSRLKTENSTLTITINQLKADNEDLATAAARMVPSQKANQLEARISDLENLLTQSRKDAEALHNTILRERLAHHAATSQENALLKSRCERMMEELTALRAGKSVAENAAISAAGLQERFTNVARERDMLQERLAMALRREKSLLKDVAEVTEENSVLRKGYQDRTTSINLNASLRRNDIPTNDDSVLWREVKPSRGHNVRNPQ